jgi:hypothetical protein
LARIPFLHSAPHGKKDPAQGRPGPGASISVAATAPGAALMRVVGALRQRVGSSAAIAPPEGLIEIKASLSAGDFPQGLDGRRGQEAAR